MTDWIAVLNSDVELAPDYLAKLLAAPMRWFATGKILSCRRVRSRSMARSTRCAAAAPRGASAAAARTARASPTALPIASPPWTAALFAPRSFRRVGLLEESFESYLEDVDFGLRCAARGIAGVYVPAAVAWHQGSATLGRWHPETVRRIARNQVFLLARHYPARAAARAGCWPIAVAQLLWGGVALRHGAGLAWLRGVLQGLAGFPRACENTWRPIDDKTAGWLLTIAANG